MMIASLADSIISEINHLIHEDLIVADTSGMIIASTDKNRVNTFHEGALICTQKKQKFIITQENQAPLKGVKAGINLPILFQNQIAGVIGITGNPERVSAYAEILKRMTELMMNERYYSEQLEWQARALEAFVFDWVQKSDWSEEFIHQAELIGIDLSIERQVLIGHCSDVMNNKMLKDLMENFSQDNKDVFVRWGNDRFIILQADQKTKERTLHFAKQINRHFKTRYQVNASIGIGQPASPRMVHQSFHEAERALSTAKKSGAIIFDDDLRLEMLLKDIKKETKVEFIRRTISQVMNDQELIKTVKTFLRQNQSFKATADALHIHINTLHYRIKRVEELTGLNLRHTEDLLIFHLAFLFLDE